MSETHHIFVISSSTQAIRNSFREAMRLGVTSPIHLKLFLHSLHSSCQDIQQPIPAAACRHDYPCWSWKSCPLFSACPLTCKEDAMHVLCSMPLIPSFPTASLMHIAPVIQFQCPSVNGVCSTESPAAYSSQATYVSHYWPCSPCIALLICSSSMLPLVTHSNLTSK